MGTCNFCKKRARTISNTIGFCADCIRAHFDIVWPQIKNVHRHSRRAYELPEDPPRADHGILCGLCVHNCRIPENGTGFCGLRKMQNGFRQTASVISYAPVVPVADIPDMRSPEGQSTVTGIWPYSTMLVHLIVCTVRTTILRNKHFLPKRFQQKTSPKR